MKLLDQFCLTETKCPTSATRRRRAVVALGGGGARGLAHLGVMQAIAETGIVVERIVGVSIGSLVGAMCAFDSNIQRVQAKAIELLHSEEFQVKQERLCGTDLSSSGEDSSDGYFAWYRRIRKYLAAHRQLSRALSSPSLMRGKPVREAIEWLLPDIDIRDLQTPLSIVAVDLLSGHRIVLESGSLRKAVQASIAIPGIFPPVRWEDMLLCDIGVIDSLPTNIAKAYASDLTIGVDVGQERISVSQCDAVLDVMMRMQDIGEFLLRRHVLDSADVIIRPDVGSVPWFDFSEPARLIAAGRRATHHALSPFARQPSSAGTVSSTAAPSRSGSPEHWTTEP